MSKLDVNEYFLEVQSQYFEMRDEIEDFKELLKENKITEEEYEQYYSEIEKLTSNYQRIGYIMFLLNKPRKKSRRIDEKTLSWYKYLKSSSKEAIINENADALKDLKQILKERKGSK